MTIAVTINFANQAELIAFFAGTAALPASEAKTVAEAVKPTGKPKAEKPAAAAPAAAPAADTKPSADTAQTAVQKPAADATPTTDYPSLQKAVFELAGIVKGQGLSTDEHVLALAKKFGFDNFKAMKDAGPAGAVHFADALVAVNAKIEELSSVVA